MLNDARAIKEALAECADEFCLHLFPDGEIHAGRFYIGNLFGDRGKSLVVNLRGSKVGYWKDFASGEGGSNLLDLLCQKCHCGFHGACLEASKWLSGNFGMAAGPAKNKQSVSAWKAIKVSDCDLFAGSTCDYRALSKRYSLSEESLHLAQADRILYFFEHPSNGRCWSVVDPGRHVRQDRRLDGEPFIFADGSTAKARTLGRPSYPVGYTAEKSNILLCEGSTDLLAAYQLIYAEGLKDIFAPVAILGATNGINEQARRSFDGKNVLIFPDYDEAGIGGALRWINQLRGHTRECKIFDYGRIKDIEGNQIKDLRDFLRVDPLQRENYPTIKKPLGSFLSRVVFHNAQRAG